MGLRAYIIDDEAPSRRELRYLLEQNNVEIAGEAATGNAGLKGILESKPQVVFLDIHMPGLGGLELARVLRELPEQPLVIFATAYERYAVNAFDLEAFDYILKPFTAERILKTLQKAQRHLCLAAEEAPAGSESRARTALPDLRKVLLLKGDRIIPVSPEKIVCARCVEGAVVVTTRDDTYRTRATLNELESRLLRHGFVRTHRGSLVNINSVQEVVPWFHGSYKLIMNDRDRTEVVVSRANAKELRRFFDL